MEKRQGGEKEAWEKGEGGTGWDVRREEERERGGRL